MACVEDKIRPHSPSLMAVPRTTLESDARQDDPWTVPSAAGCTPYLDKDGWFLVRFMRGVRRRAFAGFTLKVFRGQLQPPEIDALREAVKLPRPF